MFINFFLELKQAGVPVSIKEYLTLMGAMEKGCADYDVNHFYYLSRSALVKDERNLDKFDRVFAHAFKGLGVLLTAMAQLPAWCRLVVVGDGDLRAGYAQQARSLGLVAGALTPPADRAAGIVPRGSDRDVLVQRAA